jgi:hypothetical protein
MVATFANATLAQQQCAPCIARMASKRTQMVATFANATLARRLHVVCIARMDSSQMQMAASCVSAMRKNLKEVNRNRIFNQPL